MTPSPLKMRSVGIFDLWSRYKSKFGLLEQQPDDIILRNDIMMTTSVDDLLLTPNSITGLVEITTPSNVTLYTVPVGIRAHLSLLDIHKATGDFTFNKVWVESPDGVLTVLHQLTSNFEWSSGALPDVVLGPGYKIGAWFDSVTTAGNVALTALVSEEEVY